MTQDELSKLPPLNKWQEDIIYGSLLGDASLSIPSRFTKEH